MLNKEQVNELFAKEFKYFFTAHSNTPLELNEDLRSLFINDRYYNAITKEIFDYETSMDIVKEIVFKTLLLGATIKDSTAFIDDLLKFVSHFWKSVNYKDYDIIFTSNGNKLGMTIFSKDVNPKNPNKSVYIVEDPKSVHKFAKQIIDVIADDVYKDYAIFTLNTGGINNREDYNICLNSTKMKKVMKDYAITIGNMHYK